MLRSLEVEFLSLSASIVAVSSICAAQFSNMYSTQADNNFRKLQLRCGCQFHWCAPVQIVTGCFRCQIDTAGSVKREYLFRNIGYRVCDDVSECFVERR
jgi:hypothetical protein